MIVSRKRLDVDRAMITRLVKQMETDQLGFRRIDPADNRFTFARLNDMGIALYDKVIDRIQELENLLLRGMDKDDLRCLQTSLEHIRKNAEDILAGEKNQPALVTDEYLWWFYLCRRIGGCFRRRAWGFLNRQIVDVPTIQGIVPEHIPEDPAFTAAI